MKQFFTAVGIAGAALVVLWTETFAQAGTFTVQNDTEQFVRAICQPSAGGTKPAYLVSPGQTRSGISCPPSNNNIQVSLRDDNDNPYWENFSHNCDNVMKITVEEDVQETVTIDGSVTTSGEDETVTIEHEYGFTDSCV